MSGTKEYQDTALHIFFVESGELLGKIEENLLFLEKNDYDEDSVNALFRSVHTLKGNSGMFGFSFIESFSHMLENVLDRVRNNEISINDYLISLFLQGHDLLKSVLNIYEDNCQYGEAEIDESNKSIYSGLMAKFDELMEYEAPIGEKSSTGNEMTVGNECWHISLRFNESIYEDGLDPYSFVRYLSQKGEICNLIPIYDYRPFEDVDPVKCYLGFEIDFKSDTSKKEILDVFEFLINDCTINILPPHSMITEYVSLINSLPEETMRIGEMLKQIGTLTDKELDEALKIQQNDFLINDGSDFEKNTDTCFVGEIMIDNEMVHKPVLDAALARQKEIKKKKIKRYIRVDAEKLDILINLIGELVINGSNVKQIAGTDDKDGLEGAVSEMSRLIENIRDSTMNVRMVQIGETFKKYERIVRDLSKEYNKEIEFNIRGGDTELDKTLIDKISDPLIHLIRNAVDHGIEYPEDRTKEGKSGSGKITLNAYHETGSIVIEISDDGRGLNRDKIYQKAQDLGYLKPDESIDEYDLFQFIFSPGFTTSEQITSISGRGVGMDVVKRDIESLRGTIFLDSNQGKGTTVRIHLPLTLAIIDGFMVELAGSYYVLPLDMVIECTEIHRDELTQKDGGDFINLRGDVLPYLKLRDFFSANGDYPLKPRIIVVEYAKKRAGLVVDDLVGELQTVIKPLGKIFHSINWLSGSTILGTGDVAFILDVPKLIDHSKKQAVNISSFH